MLIQRSIPGSFDCPPFQCRRNKWKQPKALKYQPCQNDPDKINGKYDCIKATIHRAKIITVEPQLSGLFLWSQFGHEYLLVTIKIRSHILFKTTALKGAVKCERFCSQRAKAALALVVSSEEHWNEL